MKKPQIHPFVCGSPGSAGALARTQQAIDAAIQKPISMSGVSIRARPNLSVTEAEVDLFVEKLARCLKRLKE